jgi:glucan-binding YG repeat protein
MMMNKVKSRVLILMLVMALTVTGMAMPATAYGAEDTDTQATEELAAPAEETAEEEATEEEATEEEAAADTAEQTPADEVTEEEAEPVDIKDATVEGVEDRYTYTGSNITPDPVITVEPEDGEAEVVLEEGEDYTVTYTDSKGNEVDALKKAGDYQVVIEGTGDEYTGTETIDVEVYIGKGWNKIDGVWYYYKSDNTKLTNGWAQSGSEYCWMDANGKMVTNKWMKISGQWYYLKSNGYRARNEWAKDRAGWMWMDGNGRIVKSRWIKTGGEWYYLKSSGYKATKQWTKDSHGWMWMDGNGRIVKNKWIWYRGSWYYLKSNGYMAANEWAKDSKRAYWMSGNGKLSYLKQGARYVWGASGPNSFDCSGFTMYYMKMRGYNLPHNAAGQYNYLRSKNIGTNWHNAKPGDLVFYSYGGPSSSHHVGIYVGNGKLLHASSSHGKVVVTSVTYTNGHIAAICRP